MLAYTFVLCRKGTERVAGHAYKARSGGMDATRLRCDGPAIEVKVTPRSIYTLDGAVMAPLLRSNRCHAVYTLDGAVVASY